MADRTVKMYGKAYGANPVAVTVNFNDVEVFNATVTSVNEDVDQRVDWADLIELCGFTIDTSVSGNVPISITVSGGDLIFHTFHANYAGAEFNDEIGPGISGALPHPWPVTLDTKAHFADISGITYDNTDINRITGDGKTNIVIAETDLSEMARAELTEMYTSSDTGGVRNFCIYDGQTMTADLYVQPIKTNNSADYTWESIYD